jgi:hypothetical protein
MPSATKKTKKENSLILNAEVGLYKRGHGLTKLGKIIKSANQFLLYSGTLARLNILARLVRLFTGTWTKAEM